MQYKSLLEFDDSQENIDQLKAEYGNIYQIEVADIPFIIRPLYPEDWASIVQLLTDNPKLTQSDFDDKIVEAGLIGPLPDLSKGGWAALPAGISPTLSMHIRAKSGFMVPELADIATITAKPLGSVIQKPGPSQEELDKLKPTCPFTLHQLEIENYTFIVRPITRQEWRVAAAKAINEGDEEAKNLAVASRVVLWPKKVSWDKEVAGLCETITQYVLTISGYTAQPTATKL